MTCGEARRRRSGREGGPRKLNALPPGLEGGRYQPLFDADVLRIQHLLGQKPHEAGAARRQVLQGVSVDRSAFEELPMLVIGAGLDRYVPEPTSERVADWLGATYEPFGAHSHYGLVLGEQGYLQVADAIRAFLEANRL